MTADAVIAANGMEWRRLEVDGVDELLDRGVYYGAGRSEAARCGGDRGRRGRRRQLGRPGSPPSRPRRRAGDDDRARRPARARDVRVPRRANRAQPARSTSGCETNVTAVHADGDELGAVTISDGTGKSEQLRAAALFLCIGGTPRTAWAGGAGVRVNRAGFVLTGSDLLEDGRRPEGLAARPRPARARDDDSRPVRRRRSAQRVDQARRRGSRGGGDGSRARPPPARRAGRRTLS